MLKLREEEGIEEAMLPKPDHAIRLSLLDQIRMIEQVIDCTTLALHSVDAQSCSARERGVDPAVGVLEHMGHLHGRLRAMTCNLTRLRGELSRFDEAAAHCGEFVM